MIQRVPKEPRESKYGKYFLAFEAPGDDDDNTQQPMTVVRARPNNRARFDFTNNLVEDNDIDTPQVDAPPEDDITDDDLQDIPLPDTDDAGDVGDDDFPDIDLPDLGGGETQTPDANPQTITPRGRSRRYDFTTGFDDPGDDVENDFDDDTTTDAPVADNTPATTDAPADAGGDVAAPEIDDTDFATDDPGAAADADAGVPAGGNVADDAPTTDTPPTDDAGGDNGIDVPVAEDPPDFDDTDFTGDDADTGEDPNAAPVDDGSDPNAQTGPGLEYDSVRKYTLFKEFMRLRTAVSKYIERLEASISDDPEANQIIKIATDKFREIYDLLTDYMMMKYELCTYVQNLLFYERIVASVQLVFKLLKTSNDLKTKEDKDEKHSTRRSSTSNSKRDRSTTSTTKSRQNKQEVAKATKKK